ncbi:MAG: acyltransferase domain-containing protein, partial [Actinomycetota bacterium]|nr:acyltransferase domain-containing protein [Actinomycetota bacterium]
ARGATPRRAAINSLGIGGTNCHVVLEEGPTAEVTPARDAELLCLSAHDPEALCRVAASYAHALRDNPTVDLRTFAGAVNRRANLRRHRIGLVVSDLDDAIHQLDAVVSGRLTGRQARDSVAFLFPGPGSQARDMAAALRDDPVFAEALATCDRIASPLLGTSLLTALDAPGMDHIAMAQPLVFAISYATHRWLASVGVAPDVALGHSAGEYAAACAAGILDVQEALPALIARGEAMSRTASGAMAAVFADRSTVDSLTARFNGRVVVAADNGPRQLVLSGPSDDMAQLTVAMTSAGITTKPLAISCGAHSPLMAAAMPALSAALDAVTFHPPTTPFISSRTAELTPSLDAGALTRQLREPVRFSES